MNLLLLLNGLWIASIGASLIAFCLPIRRFLERRVPRADKHHVGTLWVLVCLGAYAIVLATGVSAANAWPTASQTIISFTMGVSFLLALIALLAFYAADRMPAGETSGKIKKKLTQ